MTDTIFALATAAGRAAVAVVRVSGACTRDILRSLAGQCPRPRVASLLTLRDRDGLPLDQALVLWFPSPHSYTGEDSAEFHVHGGAAVVEALTIALTGLGARLAEPGEFTRRAFENGKLDLGQAEAVADLVEAETQAQARQALGQLGGALRRRYDEWRGHLVEALSLLEAAVDFPDEEVPEEVALAARQSLGALVDEIASALSDQHRGQRIREGYRVAIIGATNAGKSSLLNALAGRSVAIVTEIAGSTRDVIETPVVIAGYKVLLADMAGIRETDDPVEVEGVRRARAWAGDADLRIWMVDGAESNGSWRQAAAMLVAGDLCLLNKCDRPAGADRDLARAFANEHGLRIEEASLCASPPTSVVEFLTRRVTEDLGGSEFPPVTRARHAALLGEARTHLTRAGLTLTQPELAAENVRLAARALERLIGKVGPEDVLDRVFASFCIGK